MGASDAVFTKIEGRMKKIDQSKQKLKAVYKFIITDNSGAVMKTWVLDLKSLTLTVSDAAADCTCKISDQDMCDLGAGKITITDAVAKGKATIEGDKSLAELLQPFVAEL